MKSDLTIFHKILEHEQQLNVPNGFMRRLARIGRTLTDVGEEYALIGDIGFKLQLLNTLEPYELDANTTPWMPTNRIDMIVEDYGIIDILKEQIPGSQEDTSNEHGPQLLIDSVVVRPYAVSEDSIIYENKKTSADGIIEKNGVHVEKIGTFDTAKFCYLIGMEADVQPKENPTIEGTSKVMNGLWGMKRILDRTPGYQTTEEQTSYMQRKFNEKQINSIKKMIKLNENTPVPGVLNQPPASYLSLIKQL